MHDAILRITLFSYKSKYLFIAVQTSRERDATLLPNNYVLSDNTMKGRLNRWQTECLKCRTIQRTRIPFLFSRVVARACPLSQKSKSAAVQNLLCINSKSMNSFYWVPFQNTVSKKGDKFNALELSANQEPQSDDFALLQSR